MTTIEEASEYREGRRKSTLRLCVEKYYTSNLARTGKLPKIMLHVFAFLDPNSEITYWVFLKILKLHPTLVFQLKVRHPYTNDGFAIVPWNAQ